MIDKKDSHEAIKKNKKAHFQFSKLKTIKSPLYH